MVELADGHDGRNVGLGLNVPGEDADVGGAGGRGGGHGRHVCFVR